MAFFFHFWTPLFLGHHRLSIRDSQRSISLTQTFRKVMRAFMRLVTTFRNVCTVFHALWAPDSGNRIFWFFVRHPFLSAIIDKNPVACDYVAFRRKMRILGWNLKNPHFVIFWLYFVKELEYCCFLVIFGGVNLYNVFVFSSDGTTHNICFFAMQLPANEIFLVNDK